MKVLSFLSALALAGSAAAWNGQLAADAYNSGEGGQVTQEIHLTDYATGSTYQGWLYGGFNGCTTTECSVYFEENSGGNYQFTAKLWRTSDGCHNIDFQGAFDAGHGYCCGSLPCDISA
ncbi:uncharacterized protein N7511_004055 [Penicillium nucicola]|uniref:uncharacterized protein n=1 Tax=Penicillium nucicola TaxID=1850975 RepID=UPI002545709E|nr:uncharacterized protein N7511_004055 [Penicillium nucicola]KAJ5766439.1 hypothetical protein N7511_004055 [Penicillium nucicola]